MNMDLYDVIIVGGGPAGLSAALMLGRCRRRVIVCDAGRPRNRTAQAMHGYLSRDGSNPLELLRLGREEIARYGVEFRQALVADVRCEEGRAVEALLDDGQVLIGRKLLLATGLVDVLPDIPGIQEYYGKSVWHCPYCDGWENRDQPLAVYGAPREATGLAVALLTWTDQITVCTDGHCDMDDECVRRLEQFGLPLRTQKIVGLEGAEGQLERIIFAQGEPLSCRGMFFNTGQWQRSTIADKLGCRFDENGHVQTDARGRTGVGNVFLAGDANGDVQFVIVAAGEGATTAVAINKELQDEDRVLRYNAEP